MAKAIKDLKLEEAQELLSFIGIDDAETFKDTFGQKFFTKETAITNDEIRKAVVGKRMTEIESSILKIGKLVNPELSRAKIAEKQVEENLEEIASLFGAKISDLETKAKSGNDKKLNDLEKMIEDKEKSLLSYKELAEKTAAEKDAMKNEFETGIKKYKIKHQYDEAKSRLAWIDDVTDVNRIGYDTVVGQKYKFDLDEKDNLIILTADGKPIPSKAKGGAMADPLEILEIELEANKLKKNNNSRSNQNPIIFGKNNQSETKKRELPIDTQRRLNQIGR